MKAFIYIFLLFVAISILRIIITKSNLNEAEQLRSKFSLWVDNHKNESGYERPNNQQFARLYKLAYHEKNAVISVTSYKDIGPKIEVRTDPVDVIQSFPTTQPDVYKIEVGVLDNLVDYFEDEYRQNFRFSFWLNFIIFLPQKFVQYVGLKEDSILSKVLNVIYWIIAALFILYKPLLRNIIVHFLK